MSRTKEKKITQLFSPHKQRFSGTIHPTSTVSAVSLMTQSIVFGGESHDRDKTIRLFLVAIEPGECRTAVAYGVYL
jgi:hypothetical protein